MKKLISLLIITFLTMVTTSINAQDTVYFDVSNQMVVTPANANSPSYTQDSSKTDTLHSFNSGVQTMSTFMTLYTVTIPSTYNSYKVNFDMIHKRGTYNYSVDTNFITYISGDVTNLNIFDSLIMKSGDVIDFNISNINLSGAYEVVVDIIHTVDTIFVTNIITGINNITEKENISFSVYPNPTTSFIALKGLSTSDRFKIYNLQGQLIKEGRARKQINVSELPSGIYFLHLPNIGLSKKFVKK